MGRDVLVRIQVQSFSPSMTLSRSARIRSPVASTALRRCRGIEDSSYLVPGRMAFRAASRNPCDMSTRAEHGRGTRGSDPPRHFELARTSSSHPFLPSTPAILSCRHCGRTKHSEPGSEVGQFPSSIRSKLTLADHMSLSPLSCCFAEQLRICEGRPLTTSSLMTPSRILFRHSSGSSTYALSRPPQRDAKSRKSSSPCAYKLLWTTCDEVEVESAGDDWSFKRRPGVSAHDSKRN